MVVTGGNPAVLVTVFFSCFCCRFCGSNRALSFRWMDAWMDGWMAGWMHAWMDAQIIGRWMDGWI